MISSVNLLRGEILEILEEAEIPLMFAEIKEELRDRDLTCDRRSLRTALDGLRELGLVSREKKSPKRWIYQIVIAEVASGKKGPP